MRDVRTMGGVAVCAGQSEFSAGGCRDLMVEGAIDVCNFDASWSGGPTEWRRVAGMALTFDVTMGHHEEPQVAGHLLASIPHGARLAPPWTCIPARRSSTTATRRGARRGRSTDAAC
jgi:L-alanine-DL-glutamate epimerase-like enolase superfamily enzyme